MPANNPKKTSPQAPAAASTPAAPAAPTGNYLIIAVLVGFVAIVATLLIGRIFVTQALLNNKIITKKSAADTQLLQNIENVKTLASSYASLGAAQQIITNGLPAQSDFPALNGLMENIAKVSGVKLTSVDTALAAASASSGTTTTTSTAAAPAAAGGPDRPKEFAFVVDINGDYPKIINFITNLEKSARPMRITNISVDNATGGLDVKLSITTYYQPATALQEKTEEVK